jgi:uncharacterized membrane protein YccC
MTHPLARILAIALTIALFVVGGRPEAGAVFSGAAHTVAHVLVYGAIAFFYARGFARWPVIAVALLVSAIGCAHEFYEISAHGHTFEFVDAGVNAVGALAGSFIGRMLKIGRRGAQ